MNDTVKPRVVCLCGSTRFYEDFQRLNFEETMDGAIVLSVGFYPHASEAMHGETIGITPGQKRMLDELHMRKIDLADEILVINKDGYVGESTRREIEYARLSMKRIRYAYPDLGPWSSETPDTQQTTQLAPGPWVIIDGIDMRNRTLLLAAPDLLSACKAALLCLEALTARATSGTDERVKTYLKTAIAKATGTEVQL